MMEWYDFSNVKSSKMLSFFPRPSGENSRFFVVVIPCLMMREVSRETSLENITIQDMINSESSIYYLLTTGCEGRAVKY